MTAPLHDSALSSHLAEIHGELLAWMGASRPPRPGEMRMITLELEAAQALAVAMERELAVHRLADTDRLARTVLGQAAAETLTRLVLDPDGKVVRPDFGRKP
ncbi:hypothetical protein [Sinorhizobium medicae]|uniref:hypothetical protein n=1 Tax=Sinorhizobium medicae TaxID=110321 RepID=UPI00041555C1|nr:hypothetical protein [Sinorhizobium medicae]RVQ76141.1 hypothetical protein CN244_06435 [Sinorhizobium medicae]